MDSAGVDFGDERYRAALMVLVIWGGEACVFLLFHVSSRFDLLIICLCRLFIGVFVYFCLFSFACFEVFVVEGEAKE